MQFLLTLLIGAVAAVHTFSFSLQVKRSDPVLVRAVIDGDTIDVTAFGRVRLLGIDAPEIGRGFDTSAPFGREARDRLASLVLHRWIRLEQEGALLDVYNRHLAYVMREDGLFVNAALVRDGLARVSARVPLTRLGRAEAGGSRSAGVPPRDVGRSSAGSVDELYSPVGKPKSLRRGQKSRAPRQKPRKSRKPKS